jgi:hypothetical protein
MSKSDCAPDRCRCAITSLPTHPTALLQPAIMIIDSIPNIPAYHGQRRRKRGGRLFGGAFPDDLMEEQHRACCGGAAS